jgi:hypothetical protein
MPFEDLCIRILELATVGDLMDGANVG